MLKGHRVILRSVEREDLPILSDFNNDLEVELASGGDPPIPQSFARLQARYDESLRRGERDGCHFAIETDGKLIGECDLFHFDEELLTHVNWAFSLEIKAIGVKGMGGKQ